LTCAPGYRDDLSRVFLIQLNQIHGNGSKTAVANIDNGQTARLVDGHYGVTVEGELDEAILPPRMHILVIREILFGF
jgi:hypothetical protein